MSRQSSGTSGLRNPIGVEFDPGDWLAGLRAGAPESGFPVRAVHQPVAPLRGLLFDS